MPMNIELKAFSEEAIRNFVKLMRTYDRLHITIVGIRGKQQELLKDLDRRHLMTFMNDREFALYFFGLFFGITPFMFIDSFSMQVPLWTEESYRWKIR